MPIAPGTQLGPYEITAPLGAGGMGELYRAEDLTLDQPAALKSLPEGVAANPDALVQFHNELLACQELQIISATRKTQSVTSLCDFLD